MAVGASTYGERIPPSALPMSSVTNAAFPPTSLVSMRGAFGAGVPFRAHRSRFAYAPWKTYIRIGCSVTISLAAQRSGSFNGCASVYGAIADATMRGVTAEGPSAARSAATGTAVRYG